MIPPLTDDKLIWDSRGIMSNVCVWKNVMLSALATKMVPSYFLQNGNYWGRGKVGKVAQYAIVQYHSVLHIHVYFSLNIVPTAKAGR